MVRQPVEMLTFDLHRILLGMMEEKRKQKRQTKQATTKRAQSSRPQQTSTVIVTPPTPTKCVLLLGMATPVSTSVAAIAFLDVQANAVTMFAF
jgi:hypothetical protein